MGKILLYNLKNEKRQQIEQLCSFMKIDFEMIKPEEYLEPIGALAGIKGIEKAGIPYTDIPFTEELLLFAGFNDKSLHDFLTRYRQAGISKIDLKAGLTPHNLLWNSIQLRNELRQEHDELADNQ